MEAKQVWVVLVNGGGIGEGESEDLMQVFATKGGADRWAGKQISKDSVKTVTVMPRDLRVQ